MTFWDLAKAVYRGSWRSLFALPLLALVPVVVELVQHAIEVHVGMYDSPAMAEATNAHPARLVFGFVKVLAAMLPGYWVVRWLAWRDAQAAVRFDPLAASLFAGMLAVHAVWAGLGLIFQPSGWGQIFASMAVGEALTALLLGWAVAAALGNAAIGPRASLRIMRPQVLWTMAFLFVTMLPLLIVHNLMGVAAVFGPHWALWPILIIDALLVGWIAALIAAANWFAAERAARMAGVELVPPRVDEDAGQTPRYAA